MNKKTKGILAGTAGVALLAGGATFATWSDEAFLGGGSIVSGDFAVTPGDAPVWYDVSGDRVDAVDPAPVTGTLGHEIDLATWKIVPEDTAEAAYEFDVTLEGDNLAAQLNLSGLDAVAGNGGEVTYRVYVPGATAGSYTEITGITNDTLTFVAHDAAANLKAGAGNIVVDDTSATDVVVVVSVSFDADDTDFTGDDIVDLDGIGVTLTQVRGNAVNGF
ncbi:alternate-type signal peptide domain-containing protein [Cellulomonas phragmiteti]|uniref:Alternate-type signal peptide domain-containing protein n=1 Tax=Cellulomonas phragmiteti TaxID=478780 RepID=A0ABQ4DJ28_9CELL|nr:alternate-type signal peptide domain-containing protein [Cellulomonas phragmiteti]GIG38992.1 hypothetical protein Cph01nite_07540 [Cellulomonas phragmiteti]